MTFCDVAYDPFLHSEEKEESPYRKKERRERNPALDREERSHNELKAKQKAVRVNGREVERDFCVRRRYLTQTSDLLVG